MQVARIALLIFAFCPAAALAAPTTIGVGDDVYHVDLTKRLVWNSSAKRQLGSVSVTYVGIAGEHQARFRRTDIKIIDTSQSGAPVPPVVMPPITTEIIVDLSLDPFLRVDGHSIRVMAASASSLTFEAGQ